MVPKIQGRLMKFLKHTIWCRKSHTNLQKPKEYMVIGILRSNKLVERISKMKVEKIITEYKGKTYFGNLSSTIEEWRFLLSCKILKDGNFSHNISMITIYL